MARNTTLGQFLLGTHARTRGNELSNQQRETVTDHTGRNGSGIETWPLKVHLFGVWDFAGRLKSQQELKGKKGRTPRRESCPGRP